MKIAIDRGNSFTKLGRFDNGLQEVLRVPHAEAPSRLRAWLAGRPASVIISSVADSVDDLLLAAGDTGFVLPFSSSTPVPVAIGYHSPATLGSDRIANAVGAVAEFGKTNCLVVDCGTCFTYTLIIDGRLEGGAISPGIQLRFRALHDGTGRLPLTQPAAHPAWVGRDTVSSLQSGVQLGSLVELAGMIEAYCSQVDALNVILTGGDAPVFEPHLKTPIFARPNLTLSGLYEILCYNERH
ncbi:MAG: type III pantothenate kinase [Flavobacteriales bacterium]|nr:type III pantothenate kinase [Flavobacteriales bacterium]